MAKTPTCPYCGAEMECAHYKSACWYHCMVCHTDSPAAGTPDDALEKAMRRASPWHSVKDGLPDSGTVCVVHGYNESGEAHYDIACKIGAGWANWGLNSFKVTHWMPLPEAPKEGD